MKGLYSRRHFLKRGAAGTLWASAPLLAPRRFWASNAPSNQITVGLIGVGSRGNHLLTESIRRDEVRVVAVADVDREHLLRARERAEKAKGIERVPAEIVNGWRLETRQQPDGSVQAYNDYRRLLDHADIDAVASATPDHWHAKIYMDSMDAGKDVYGEKPLTLSLNQGRNLVRKARETAAVFQTGSQQRSMNTFRTAVDAIRNGRLGKIESVLIELGKGRKQIEVPANVQPPAQLDWNLWLGPAPFVEYTPLRCHRSFRYFWDYSGGSVTDWGAHHCDIVQWALEMDGTGPVSIEGKASSEPGFYETFREFDFTYRYKNGIPVRLLGNGNNGITFTGSKGSLFVSRNKVESTPDTILSEPWPELAPRVPVSENHFQNWLDCIRSREYPICDVEIGHRSISIPHLCNICGLLGRSLEWDPRRELVVGDTEANAMLSREERSPFHHMAGV